VLRLGRNLQRWKAAELASPLVGDTLGVDSSYGAHMGIKRAGAIYQEIEKMPSYVDTVENAQYGVDVDWCQWSLIGARRILWSSTVLLKAWAHASSKLARFGLQFLDGAPLTVPYGPIFSTSGLSQGFAWIALVPFISEAASCGGADCECERTRLHAADLRFRVRQQPHVSNPARNFR